MEILEKEKQGFFEDVRAMAEEYVDDRIYLFKLQAAERAARLASGAYIMGIIGIFVFIILLIITVIAGYFLAFLTDNFIIGFGIVALLYVVAIFVVYSMHKRFLGKKVMDAVVKRIFETNNEPDVF